MCAHTHIHTHTHTAEGISELQINVLF
jgi:hypothetical protein